MSKTVTFKRWQHWDQKKLNARWRQSHEWIEVHDSQTCALCTSNCLVYWYFQGVRRGMKHGKTIGFGAFVCGHVIHCNLLPRVTFRYSFLLKYPKYNLIHGTSSPPRNIVWFSFCPDLYHYPPENSIYFCFLRNCAYGTLTDDLKIPSPITYQFLWLLVLPLNFLSQLYFLMIGTGISTYGSILAFQTLSIFDSRLPCPFEGLWEAEMNTPKNTVLCNSAVSSGSASHGLPPEQPLRNVDRQNQDRWSRWWNY